MSDARVTFDRLDELGAEPGKEQTFSFACPLHKGRRCESLVIAGRTDLKRDPQGQNGGIAQWDWDGNRERPTFGPSVSHKGCWHGYIRGGRCYNTGNVEEPEPTA